MEVILLGTAGYHPNELRQTACVMIPEFGIILDAGSAFYRVRDLIATNELDIFLTHAHLDHIVGLTYLHDVLFQKAVSRVTVHARAQKLRAIEDHLFHKEIFPIAPAFASSNLADVVELENGIRIKSFELDHPGGSVGFRLDGPNASLAYVTDTTKNGEYLDHIMGVDLLIHECYFPDGFDELALETGHCCTSHAANIAKQADVGMLVLTHINPLNEEDDPIGLAAARAIFEDTYVGDDGMVIDLSPPADEG